MSNDNLSQQSKPSPSAYVNSCADDKINIFQLFIMIKSNWKIFAITCSIATALGVAIALIWPLSFKSTSKLVVVSSDDLTSGLSSVISQGLSLPFGFNKADNGDVIMNYLDSRSFREAMIKKYDLLPFLYESKWDKEKKKWKSDAIEDIPTVGYALDDNAFDEYFKNKRSKDTNIITIEFVCNDPSFAQLMLVRCITELKQYIDNDYETDAHKNRVFLESRLAASYKEMKAWEVAVPTVSTNLQDIQRELRATTGTYTDLKKQLELAKIQEVKDQVSFKELDKPNLPVIKYRPKRSLIVAGAFLLSFLGCLAYISIRTRVRQCKNREI